jgi:hypothetical protein
MSSRDRALTGAKSVSSPSKNEALTFPASLLHPPQSQLTRYEDVVGQRLLELDMWASKLGEGFGISFTSFSLNPLQTLSSEGSMAALAITLTALTHRNERVSLERRSGKWGLFFTREPTAFANDRKIETSPLKDAPLDVRERFLGKSEDFFRQYLQLCEDRLGRMKSSVASADQTLALLRQIELR